jgi:hypothetical protein
VIKTYYGDEFRLIDGHHHISVLHKKIGEAFIWVVESHKDLIPFDSAPEDIAKHLKFCNAEIKRRFQHAHHYIPMDDSGNDILTIDRLIDYNNIRL